ncbi:MAG TPA: serine hydrolase, partial [Anaerolineaceae bacterium]|nr:serine hydrolase [Anaerolineaceae bacterium]
MKPSPVERDDQVREGWRIDDPESTGVDARRLQDLEQVIPSQYRNINGIVVVRKGAIVFERYFNGYGSEDAHHVASVTKSITSALIGIAIADGSIQSVEQKVLDFFPEYPVGLHELQKRAVTLRHLLTKTAPFAWPAKIGHEPLDRLRRQRDWVTYILKLLGQGGPAGKFQYCTAGAHLLSAVISRATGMCAREFANARLFR